MEHVGYFLNGVHRFDFPNNVHLCPTGCAAIQQMQSRLGTEGKPCHSTGVIQRQGGGTDMCPNGQILKVNAANIYQIIY